MNPDFQLKLQAYLDGELSERETRAVEEALAGDADARALLTELRNTSGALADFEASLKLPETREFFWSKVELQIQRELNAATRHPAPVPFWRRLLVPTGAFAALVLLGLIGFRSLTPVNSVETPAVETFLTDAGAMTYRDDVEQMTVVWLSYPAENEFAQYE